MNLKKLFPDLSLMVFGLAMVVLGILSFNSAERKSLNINENSPRRNGGKVISEFVNTNENQGGQVLGKLISNFGTGGIDMVNDGFSFVQEYPIMVPDGSGGVYVGWNDERAGTLADAAYIQHINSSGVKQFTSTGLLIGSGIFKDLVRDSSGNLIVLYGNSLKKVTSAGATVWTTQVNTGTQTTIVAYGDAYIDGSDNVYIANVASTHVYVNKVNSAGTPQWGGTNGLQITSVTTNGYPQVTTDGAGGMITSWTRFSTPRDVYIQRITSAGSVSWTAGGVQVDPATGNDEYNAIISDGAGGAVVSYENATAAQVRIQRFNSSGVKQWGVNGINIQATGGFSSVFTPTLLSDGAGGYILSQRYISRFNSSGSELWESVSTADGYGKTILTSSNKIIHGRGGGFGGQLSVSEYNLDGTQLTTDSLSITASEGSPGGYTFYPLESSGNLYIAYTTANEVYVTQFEINYNIKNIPLFGGISVVLSDNTTLLSGTNSTGANGSNELIRVRDNGVYVLESNLDLTRDRDWSGVTFDSNAEVKRALVTNWAEAEGADSEFAMFVPKEPGDTGVRICPSATTMQQTNPTCTGGYELDESDSSVSIVTINTQEYWKVEGLSGTGGLSLPQPDFLQFYTVSPYGNQISTIDFLTGFEFNSQTLSLGGADPAYTGLSWHPRTCTLYGVYRDDFAPPYSLVTIDPITGTTTNIGEIGYDISNIAFDDEGNLYGVSGSADANNPEALISINTTTGAGSVLIDFATGDYGETISFNIDNSLMYHLSGAPDSAETLLFESINLDTLARNTISTSGPVVGAPTDFYYVNSLNRFIFVDWNSDAFYLDLDGTITAIGNGLGIETKGTVETNCPYGAGRNARIVLRDSENTSAVTDIEIWFNTPYDITSNSIINVSYLTDFTGGAALTTADIEVTCDPDGVDPLSGTAMTNVTLVSTVNGYFQLNTNSDSCSDWIVIDLNGNNGNSMTNPSTPGNYGWSIAYDSGGDGIFDGDGATLAYVQDENDVQITAYVPPVLDMELYQTGVDQLLNGTGANTCALGVLSINTVSTCTYDIGTGTNNLAGVTITITSDGSLNDGLGNEIDSCSGTNCDGLGSAGVNAGEEEYGIYISDLGAGEYTASNSFGIQHQAVPTVEITFATTNTTGSGTTTGSIVQRLEVTHAASISTATNQGGYNQVVTFKAYTN